MESEQVQITVIATGVVMCMLGCLWMSGMFMSFADIEAALNHTPSSFVRSVVVWCLVAFCVSFFFLQTRLDLAFVFGLLFLVVNWYTFGFSSLFDMPCITEACILLFSCHIARLLYVHVLRHRGNQNQVDRNFHHNVQQQPNDLPRQQNPLHLAQQHHGVAAENIRDPPQRPQQANLNIQPIHQQLIRAHVPEPLPVARVLQLHDVPLFRRAAVPEEAIIEGSNRAIVYPPDFEEDRSVISSVRERHDELGQNVHSMPIGPADNGHIHRRQPGFNRRNAPNRQEEEQRDETR